MYASKTIKTLNSLPTDTLNKLQFFRIRNLSQQSFLQCGKSHQQVIFIKPRWSNIIYLGGEYCYEDTSTDGSAWPALTDLRRQVGVTWQQETPGIWMRLEIPHFKWTKKKSGRRQAELVVLPRKLHRCRHWAWFGNFSLYKFW